MKINARVDVKWDRGAINKIVREAAENVFAERARQASALKCEIHSETATITPTAGSLRPLSDASPSQEFSITACCHEHRDRVARFLVGE